MELQQPEPERMPNFSKVALGLSYLKDGSYDSVEADCPEYARRALEDALKGVTPEITDIVPEDEREDVSRAFAKLFRITAGLARERLAQASGVEVRDLLKEQEGLDDGGE